MKTDNHKRKSDSTRYWYNVNATTRTQKLSNNSVLNVIMNAQYDGALLDFEQNLISFRNYKMNSITRLCLGMKVLWEQDW